MKFDFNNLWRMAVSLAAGCMMTSTARAQVSQTIGTLQPGQEVIITYEVTIDDPLSPSVTQISSQGVVSGSNFSNVSTDDPETTTANDATLTSISNDPPVVDLNGGVAGNDVTVAFTEQTAQLIAPAGTISDAEGNPILSLTATLVARPDGDSTESLSLNGGANTAASGAGLTVGYSSATGVLSITGSASLATYETILQGILYNNTSENPTTTDRSVTVVANDTNDSVARTATITVARVNDPPTGGNNTVTTLEDVNKTFAVSDFPFGDVDGNTFDGIQVVTVETAGDLEEGGVDVTAGDIIEDVTTLVFKPAANASGSPYATFTFKVRDSGGALSTATYTMTINVTPVNDNPIAGTDTIDRSAKEDVKVLVATLLANDTDPENDTLSITGVTSPTPGGATVTLNGGWIYYTHVGTTADTFTYTLSDGHGGTAIGTVNVNIKDADAQSRTTLSITVDGGGAHIRADGIPGRSYAIQSSNSASGPWTDLGSASADAKGIYTFDDPAGTPLRFYRSVFREP